MTSPQRHVHPFIVAALFVAAALAGIGMFNLNETVETILQVAADAAR